MFPRARPRPSSLTFSSVSTLVRAAVFVGTIAALGATGCRRNTHHWGRDRKGPEAVASAPVVEDRVVLPPVPPSEPPPRPVAAPPPRKKPAPVARPSTCGPRGPGQHYVVHGVDSSDVLNIRAQPDWKSTVVGTLPPDADGIAAGATRARPGATPWRHVTCGKISGWVNERFLAAEDRGASDEP